MSDDSDLDLYKAQEPEVEPDTARAGPSPWPVIIGIVAIAVAAVAFYWFRPQGPEAPTAPVASSPPATAPVAPRVDRAPVEETTLPPLDESDPAVRDLVGGVSDHPLVAAWVGGEQLVRGATQVVVALADGQALPPALRRFAPQARFAVRASGGRTVIDPASYRRFDAVGAAAVSIDPARAAAAYRSLRPRLGDAFQELGMSGTVDDLVRRATDQVLAVPVIDGELPVVSKGVVYAYADPRLEALPPASKLLLRMGPETVRKVQALARGFRAAAFAAP